MRIHWSDETFDGEPTEWVDPLGLVWDLDATYRGFDGSLWHWAGGFVNEQDRGVGFVPIMSTNNWDRIDVSLVDCPHPMIKQEAK
jgi:hypothetical protein